MWPSKVLNLGHLKLCMCKTYAYNSSRLQFVVAVVAAVVVAVVAVDVHVEPDQS